MSEFAHTPEAVHDFVVVANRLPVDVRQAEDGDLTVAASPGGLVAALDPVIRHRDAAWVGWAGAVGSELEPFDLNGIWLVPVPLGQEDVEQFYEGFSNDTLWPLYHDVLVPPTYHRDWWVRYQDVNRRFAERAAAIASRAATVWVHDYQLQLVPRLLRELRPDLSIGYFHHVPFPPSGIFMQLPWRQQVVEGLLGADVVGFQRSADAANFVTAARRLASSSTRQAARGSTVTTAAADGRPHRTTVRAFPISIDVTEFERLAADPVIRARAEEIRAGFGDGRKIVLGVDRLDYTKGIAHRIKAFGELLEDCVIGLEDAALIQVASPTREGVQAYQQLRDDVELLVGRINGAFSTIDHRPVHYLHRELPREEMVAMYLAADIALITPLRDGMNLVAKEYVAARIDGDGVLVLSEFAGAADELRKAVLVNPHDIGGMKEAIVSALRMPTGERRARMRSMRRRLKANDVQHWAGNFVAALGESREEARAGEADTSRPATFEVPDQLEEALIEFSCRTRVLVAIDFDGTLAPFTDDPARSRMLTPARRAIKQLTSLSDTAVAIVSGRALADLEKVTGMGPGVALVGSHGAEFRVGDRTHSSLQDPSVATLLAQIADRLRTVAKRAPGAWVETKPIGFALHTRALPQSVEEQTWERAKRSIEEIEDAERLVVREGRHVLEFSAFGTTKGDAIDELRSSLGVSAVFFAGDDVTDEDAFAALAQDDISVKCGPGDTLARFRVAEPASMAEVLRRLAQLRSDCQNGPRTASRS
jgi:trehalose 6-phosphate synthase/phosphatase